MNNQSATSRQQALHIFFLRHGECEDAGMVRGITNSSLTEFGRKQMEQAVLGQSAWTDIVCSPLSRCLNFARDIAGKEAVPLIIEPGFQEIDFGDWEGLSWQFLQREQPEAVQAYFENPLLNSTHSGEQYDKFLSRVLDAWCKLLPRLQGDRVLIVTHGGVIKSLLSSFLKIPMEAQTSLLVPHGCLSHLLLHTSDARQHVFLQSHNSANMGVK